MNRVFCLSFSLLFVFVMIFFYCVPCSGLDLLSEIKDVEQRMDSVRTLSARFVQVKKMAMFEMPLEIRGTIHVDKPDRFAWKVEEPVEYSLVMDGKQMVKWDAESKKSTTISLNDNMMVDTAVSQIKKWFSGQYSDFLTDYDIVALSETPLSLRFQPKPENPASGIIEAVVVDFREDKRYLEQIRITEISGDDTLIRFEDIRINLPIESSVWTTAK
ncbi:conserved exported hypothetical protein [Desulfamplus magnetovallimortis]|uniref:Outer membrane lipoprotein carrier protein LolA n=1 Tax=Desulfamplus magnetovallimortis TaxID=1246637 RepID=L0R728_9BACT|nr:outer membrane lipoprotein carrier protein LolA [Desulfamplus magnetovallimortis]CCO06771.1 conserved exported hypothetical protein [Desulfamplus magnetovallimortis BW-1]SLM32822.1 conserved exported hypothetical protein [Desulfamplus magnetovallimortis]